MTPHPARLRELPLGAIRAQGWLADQLRLQADGQTGQLEEIWADVGPDSGWLGGGGEAWERGPYYLDGLVPLAYVLHDEGLQAKAQKWVEAILASQGDNGMFGPTTNADWWSRMVVLKVMTQYADATEDERVPPFLRRYFEHQRDHLPARPLEGWGRARGADNVISIMWLYDKIQEPWLLDLAQLVLTQTDDWASFLIDQLPPGRTPTFQHLSHCVNVAMGLKLPAAQYLLDGNQKHLDTTHEMEANLDRLHGQVHGTFSGDEWLAGRQATQGVETCQVVELMYTLEQQSRIFGDPSFGDRLEEVGYNLLPASNDPQMLAHQYHQQANQVLVSFDSREWSFSGPDANIFGLEPHFGCCTANLHQGWPKLVRSLWMHSGSDSLTSVAYGPCQVDTELAGTAVRLDVRTSYPFEDTVVIAVAVDTPTPFELRLRKPAWCAAPRVEIDGENQQITIDDEGYIAIRRTWTHGDAVTLTLPMQIRTIQRDNDAVGFRLGPLVLVHGVEEIWRPVPDHAGLAEWEITPRKPWNLGAWLEDPDGAASWPVERRKVAAVPFRIEDAPLIVRGQGALIREWQLHQASAGPVPRSTVTTDMPILPMPLVPYGSARLRVAEMPTVHASYDLQARDGSSPV